MDWIAVVAALITAAGVAPLWLQMRATRQDNQRQRLAEIDSVTITTKVLLRPSRPDEDGNARWEYSFRFINPGVLSISSVRVRVEFPVPVQRVHHDGTVDSADSTLTFSTPAVGPHAHLDWERTVDIPWTGR